jgi:peroxidase
MTNICIKKNGCKKCFAKSIIKKCYEYRNLDESENNKTHSEYGKTNQPICRIAHSAYSDGFGEPNDENYPSARHISNMISDQREPIPNTKKASNIFWLWGQYIDHEITLIDSHVEPYNIEVPTGDEFFDPNSEGSKLINMNRTKFVPGSGVEGIPRVFLNRLSSFLNASNIYGSTEERNAYIREYKNGRLKESHGCMLPITNGQYENAGPGALGIFISGDIRANEHIGLTAMHTLFMREHNHWATNIKKCDYTLDDEQIYQKAKLIVEAEIQAVTFNEYLPMLLGRCQVTNYCGYDPECNPQISNLFSTCCYRLHSLIPSKILRDTDLKDLYFKPHLLTNTYDLEYVFKHYIKYICEQIDGKIVSDLRNFLFGNPGQGGHDLLSFTIQRGRDHGLPGYNVCRHALGLSIKTSFDEVSDDPFHNYGLEQVYDGDIDKCEVFISGVGEKKFNKCSMLGELFHTVIKKQFEKIRKGDRFWYENRLTCEQIDFVNKQKLSDIIKRNTNLCNVPHNVFKVHS